MSRQKRTDENVNPLSLTFLRAANNPERDNAVPAPAVQESGVKHIMLEEDHDSSNRSSSSSGGGGGGGGGGYANKSNKVRSASPSKSDTLTVSCKKKTAKMTKTTKKSVKDGSSPKRAENSFMLYRKVKEKEIRDKFLRGEPVPGMEKPSTNQKDLSKVIGEMWKALPDEEQKPFKEEARIGEARLAEAKAAARANEAKASGGIGISIGRGSGRSRGRSRSRRCTAKLMSSIGETDGCAGDTEDLAATSNIKMSRKNPRNVVVYANPPGRERSLSISSDVSSFNFYNGAMVLDSTSNLLDNAMANNFSMARSALNLPALNMPLSSSPVMVGDSGSVTTLPAFDIYTTPTGSLVNSSRSPLIQAMAALQPQLPQLSPSLLRPSILNNSSDTGMVSSNSTLSGFPPLPSIAGLPSTVDLISGLGSLALQQVDLSTSSSFIMSASGHLSSPLLSTGALPVNLVSTIGSFGVGPSTPAPPTQLPANLLPTINSRRNSDLAGITFDMDLLQCRRTHRNSNSQVLISSPLNPAILGITVPSIGESPLSNASAFSMSNICQTTTLQAPSGTMPHLPLLSTLDLTLEQASGNASQQGTFTLTDSK